MRTCNTVDARSFDIDFDISRNLLCFAYSMRKSRKWGSSKKLLYKKTYLR